MKKYTSKTNKLYLNLTDKLNHQKSGQILAEVHNLIKNHAKENTMLLTLDKMAYDYIISQGATPSFLNYHGFPNSICASVNDVLIHGIPDDYLIKPGDLLSFDVGVNYQGFHTDAAFSMVVGNNEAAQKLIAAANEALNAAIEIVKPGINVKEIGKVIEQVAHKHGYKLTREYTGHGIGKKLHMRPIIFNYYEPSYDYILKANTAIAIEPMLIAGTDQTFLDDNNWSVHSADKSLTAHVEHTLLITKEGCKILTKK